MYTPETGVVPTEIRRRTYEIVESQESAYWKKPRETTERIF